MSDEPFSYRMRLLGENTIYTWEYEQCLERS